MVQRNRGGGNMRKATTCEALLAELRVFKERHGEEYGLRSLGIFGSYARGEAGEDSDVDIVFDTSIPNLFRVVRMKQDLEEFLGRPVDVLQLRGLTNQRLKARVEREAVYV
jgi:hypothetical protein